MVHKLFWRDPYLTERDTRIARVEGEYVWLEESIFFAFSGGQESDAGSIGGQSVLEAQLDGLDIRYRLPAGHDLVPGQTVRVVIDGVRRLCLMRLHFAAEVVLELTTRALPGVARIGAHIAQDKARIDFEWPESIATLIPQLQADAQAWLNADLPIVTAFEDEAMQRRYWEVAGLARVPCGGTHVRRTSEVGRIVLKRRNPGRGKERIEITLA